MDERGILLESGTNELEIVEFLIGDNRFGINVIKVREIILPIRVTKIPHTHPHIEGIIDIRGEILPVINLKKVLGLEIQESSTDNKYIIAEFNQTMVVFNADHVTKILRFSWQQIEKPGEMYRGFEGQIVGVIKNEEGMILLLDFEKILVDINPNSGISGKKISNIDKRPVSNKKIMVAEDSALLRNVLQETLQQAGFTNISFFENGKEAIDYLEMIVNSGKRIEDEVQLLITDIEMPQMDGHHLTRRIKENQLIAKLPVIIFSSLITEDLLYRGKLLGADAQVSKPEIDKLVHIIDSILN